MSIHRKLHLLSTLAVFLVGSASFATEPNDSFAEATSLPSGTLSVDDDLAPGLVAYPDTYLGTLGFFGTIEFENDDDSIYGDDYASGLSGVPINTGETISFLVTGYDDFGFVGSHSQSGVYDVFVDVYDFFGVYVESISESRAMEPGNVEQFSFSGDETWNDGSYDVNIDNTVGSTVADVDFFTFTDLNAGASFTAEVTQEDFSGFDSYLGWFSDTGVLLDTDDDAGFDTLSLLQGTVPESGELTFAVTGSGDDDFLGEHTEEAVYALELSLSEVSTPGDYNENGTVDAADYVVWRNNLGSGTSLPNDDTLGVGPDDYTRWRTHFGEVGDIGTGSAVPEPGGLVLVIAAMIFFCIRAERRAGGL